MKKHSVILLLILACSFQAGAQQKPGQFIVMSYNVENLFDTVNHPLFEDDEFTPDGGKQWTWERYAKKLKDLAKVIQALPEKKLPAVIGLAEVENRAVLEDLLERRGLRRAGYGIVHEEGKDPRGIECALLYRKDLFSYRSHEYIPVTDATDPEYFLRDILHVEGSAPDGTSLHIFMNHWKSRSGGEKETARKRMAAAVTLRRELDRLLSRGKDHGVIIMGDFNDEPTNQSIGNGLSAGGKRKNIGLGEHYNLYYDLHNLHGLGTYAYRGNWNMLDQVIISYNLLGQEKGFRTTYDGGRILKEDWMLYTSEQYGGMFPSSTYGGPNYYGGPSDHLPVYVAFTY